MRVKASVSGGKKLSQFIDKISKTVKDGKVLDVGFLENATYPDGTPVAAVAMYNEFGTANSPARPFMRKTIADHSDKWGGNLKRILENNGGDIDQALDTMGQGIVGEIQEEIINLDTPANAPSTIRQKGFDDPLIHTDTMLKSVDYRVSDKND